VDQRSIVVDPLKGGMSNSMFVCRSAGNMAVVRFFGQMGGLIDRNEEVQVFLEMSRRRLGPACLGMIYSDEQQPSPPASGKAESEGRPAALPIGRIEEFLQGWRTLEPSDYRDDVMIGTIVTNMKKWHQTQVQSVTCKPRILQDLRRMLRKIASNDGEVFEKLASLGYEGKADVVGQATKFVEEYASMTLREEELGFCHNDLQYGNVMVKESTKELTFIDFEYSGYNPIYYDMANFWCEMAADYTEGVYGCGFHQPLGPEGFPSEETQRATVRRYLSAGGEKPSEQEIERWRMQALRWVTASHLFWGLWGLLQAENVSKPFEEGEFNYVLYAENRLSAFQRDWGLAGQ